MLDYILIIFFNISIISSIQKYIFWVTNIVICTSQKNYIRCAPVQKERQSNEKEKKRKNIECATKNGDWCFLLKKTKTKKQEAMSALAAPDFTLGDQLVKHWGPLECRHRRIPCILQNLQRRRWFKGIFKHYFRLHYIHASRISCNIQTSSWFTFLKPNLFFQIDSTSSAAGSIRCFTFSDTSSFSMQENNVWK